MTNKEKEQAVYLKRSGLSNNDIAKKLNISLNTIKALFRRCNFDINTCPTCGGPLNNKYHKKRFCSIKCKNAYWNNHKDILNRNIKIGICPYCHESFSYYGRIKKFCSRECFISFRRMKEDE